MRKYHLMFWSETHSMFVRQAFNAIIFPVWTKTIGGITWSSMHSNFYSMSYCSHTNASFWPWINAIFDFFLLHCHISWKGCHQICHCHPLWVRIILKNLSICGVYLQSIDWQIPQSTDFQIPQYMDCMIGIFRTPWIDRFCTLQIDRFFNLWILCLWIPHSRDWQVLQFMGPW